MKGQLISINKGQFAIKSDSEIYFAKSSGKLRFENQSPLVGDFVEFEPDGFVTKIYERKNELVRPKVSNVDQAIVVMSMVEPNYSSILLNKFLAIIEFNNIHPIIIFTKTDLTDETHLEEYKKQGYEAYEVSNELGEGIESLKNIFKDKLTVFTGQTGAGKSTTINSITGLQEETGEISKALGRGKHTTRMVKIIDWMGGQLIDTPGFSSLEFSMTKFELSRSYFDFRQYSLKCKFSRSCLHNKEVDCNIKTMVKEGKITEQRYKDYIRLLEEAK